MRKTLRYSLIFCCGGVISSAGCSTSPAPPPPSGDAGAKPDSSTTPPTGGSDASSDVSASSDGPASDAPSYTYTLIDDMETGTNGPIKLTGINPPLTPAYWFNFVNLNDTDGGVAHGDTVTPPYGAFTFSALPTPTTTLNGKVSTRASTLGCSLNVLNDVCGIGVEFAQLPETDGGLLDAAIADASASDAGDGGDAGPSIPRVTVPFDISQYKGIVFWGKSNDEVDGGGLDIKVAFPDTDTDPRGGLCNSVAEGASGPTDTSQCFNDYAEQVTYTNDWQEFTVLFADLAISPFFGYQAPGPWTGKMVYGINWQAQDTNDEPDAGAFDTSFSVDDVYFIQ